MYKMIGITIVAMSMVVVLGFLWGHMGEIFKPLHGLSAPDDFPKAFAGDALSLLHTGTFNWNAGHTSPYGLRGPSYAIILAISFRAFGEKFGAIYLVNFTYFLLSILLLWRISIHFFPGRWAFLPSFMLAGFWGYGAYVWVNSYELHVLFFALLCLKSFLMYQETRSPFWLAVGVSAYGIWVLEKPIMLYAIPFMLFWVLYVHWSLRARKQTWLHFLVACMLLVSFIVPWAVRNKIVLNTWQLGGGGHAILHRATQVYYSPSHLMNLALSFSLGDFIGSKISSSYPPDGKPAAWDPAVEDRWYQRGWHITEPNGEVITRMELDRRMYKEALAHIMGNPLMFIVSSPLGFLRLNAPVNLGAQETAHLLWGIKLLGSEYATIALIFAIRLVWFAFLGIVLFTLIRLLPLWRTQWGLLIFFVIYVNLMYGLLTHAEARYIFTMMPLYFILFAEGLRNLISISSKPPTQKHHMRDINGK